MVIKVDDEDAFFAAIHHLPYRVRKLKPGHGQSLLPDHLSLMNVSSSDTAKSSHQPPSLSPVSAATASDVGEAGQSSNGTAVDDPDGGLWDINEITVQFTFIHITIGSTAPQKTNKSWP